MSGAWTVGLLRMGRYSGGRIYKIWLNLIKRDCLHVPHGSVAWRVPCSIQSELKDPGRWRSHYCVLSWSPWHWERWLGCHVPVLCFGLEMRRNTSAYSSLARNSTFPHLTEKRLGNWGSRWTVWWASLCHSVGIWVRCFFLRWFLHQCNSSTSLRGQMWRLTAVMTL